MLPNCFIKNGANLKINNVKDNKLKIKTIDHIFLQYKNQGFPQIPKTPGALSICKHECIRTCMQTDRQTFYFFYFIFILYGQYLILNGQDNILFIPDRKQYRN